MGKLKTARFLAVLVASGSGKSSLVRAGLIPALRDGGLPLSESWTIRVFAPGSRPLATLAAHLMRLSVPPFRSSITQTKRQRLRDYISEVASKKKPELLRLLTEIDGDMQLLTSTLLAAYFDGKSVSEQIAMLKFSFGVHPLDIHDAFEALIGCSVAHLLGSNGPFTIIAELPTRNRNCMEQIELQRMANPNRFKELERRQRQQARREKRQTRQRSKRKQSRVLVSVHMVGDDKRFADLHLRR